MQSIRYSDVLTLKMVFGPLSPPTATGFLPILSKGLGEVGLCCYHFQPKDDAGYLESSTVRLQERGSNEDRRVVQDEVLDVLPVKSQKSPEGKTRR